MTMKQIAGISHNGTDACGPAGGRHAADLMLKLHAVAATRPAPIRAGNGRVGPF
jgi:hypothetical protein